MPEYTYLAINPAGSVVKGQVEADTEGDARRQLEGQGYVIMEIKGLSRIAGRITSAIAGFKVKRVELIEFANNLATILKAGLPLITALDDLAETTTNKYLKMAIKKARDDVVSGSSLSEALQRQRHVFPDILIRLASIGENTGRLEVSIKEAADHLQRIEDLASMIKRAMMYPMFALVTTGGALIFWLIYVLPKILTVIKEMGVQIPAITKLLMLLSNVMTQRWYAILLGIVFMVIAYAILSRHPRTKYYVDLLKIRAPIIKEIVYTKLLALFAEQMRILVSAGIIIDRCFEATAKAIYSDVFKRAIEDARQRLIKGEGIANSLKAQKVFPLLVIRMVEVGERSGNLDEQFKFLSDFYYEKLEAFTEKLGKVIEPILIALVGGMFALVAIGLMMPLYDLITKIK